MESVNHMLESIAEKVPSRIPESAAFEWVTKSRGDYITLVGMEQDKGVLEFLVQHGATEHISSSWEAGSPINIAFSPSEQKWYGWSHRAIFGFGIGSTCKKGDCHYTPTDKDDFLEDSVRFWTDEHHMNVRGEHREDYALIEWDYAPTVPNEELIGTVGSTKAYYPKKYGRGEWVAETLADARQMAIDFAEGVS